MTFKNSSEACIDLDMEVPFFTFPALSKLSFIKHGFSTRLGGVSSGQFATMNFNRKVVNAYDDPDNVTENFRRMADSIGFDVNSVVLSKQVHKTNIRLVDVADRGKGLFIPRDYDEIDGLITDKPNITLVTKYADCVPLFFVDTVKKAIGLSHSGWRGTVAKIGRITVEEMGRAFGSEPEDIIAVIGPSICKSCYEIDGNTVEEFKKAFPDKQDSILTLTDNGKYLCDLWAANRYVLSEAGIPYSNIHISGVCTSCNSDILFSHRKTQGKRGSLAAFLCITDEK
jgi:hypothetical protein